MYTHFFVWTTQAKVDVLLGPIHHGSVSRATPAHGLCITTLRSASPHTLGEVGAYMANLMRGSPDGAVEPDRHRQETLDLVPSKRESVVYWYSIQ